jgi:cytochrome c oxidase accessory protein FixG
MTTATDERPKDNTAPAAPHPRPGERSTNVLSTLNEDGSRRWLCPKPAPGKFLTARRIVAYALIAIFAVIPYLSMNGKPLVLLDVAARRFTIFGFTFHPTDTLLVAFLLFTIVLSIFLVTALFGRVWCGWACPQTVYMEFVYRPLERFFQGTPGRAKKGWLQKSGAGTFLKYPVYLAVSAFLAHVFLAYFVGVDRLWDWMHQSPWKHPEGFLIVAGVTGLMMFDFAFFREQTCIVACPYGRFQSVMLDKDSLIVSYDVARGEPRGPVANRKNKSANPDLSLKVLGGSLAAAGSPAAYSTARTGDCVDCGMCVTTCPTGIDIRNGLQMECIGCAQCIDACNSVMTKLKRPTGLIRYSSLRAMSGEKTRLLRARTLLYPILVCVALSLFFVVLSGKGRMDVTILRGLGTPFTATDAGDITNRAKIKIVNRTDQVRTYTLRADGTPDLRLLTDSNPITIAAGETITLPVMLVAPFKDFARGKAAAEIIVRDDTGFEVRKPVALMGPGSWKPAQPKAAEPPMNEPPAVEPKGDAR